MPSTRIDAAHFSPDTRAFLESLAEKRVTFEEAWPGRFDAVIQTEKGDVPLAFIGLDALVKNKRASGRPKDLDDLAYLTRKE